MSKPDLKAKLEDVNAQIASVEKDAQTKWAAFEEKRDAFAKSGNEANRTDSQEFKDAEQVHREYAAACAELKQLEQVRDGVFAMVAPDAPAPSAATVPSEQKQQQPVQQEQAGGSLSERIASGKGYRDLVDSGVLGSDRRGGFQAKLADMSVAEVKTLITGLSDTSGGAFVFSDVKPYVAQPRRQPRLFDLITTGSTVSDTVEYARQTTFTNVAAETAEATATSTGTKPEATIAFERVTEYVRTIAHYIPATRRALADVGQLSTLIDSQLRYGLELRLEGQIVAGGGTGEDLKGILNQSNILTQALSTDSVADAIHKAVTQIRLGTSSPTASRCTRTTGSCSASRGTTPGRSPAPARTCTGRRRRRSLRRSGACRSR